MSKKEKKSAVFTGVPSTGKTEATSATSKKQVKKTDKEK